MQDNYWSMLTHQLLEFQQCSHINCLDFSNVNNISTAWISLCNISPNEVKWHAIVYRENKVILSILDLYHLQFSERNQYPLNIIMDGFLFTSLKQNCHFQFICLTCNISMNIWFLPNVMWKNFVFNGWSEWASKTRLVGHFLESWMCCHIQIKCGLILQNF